MARTLSAALTTEQQAVSATPYVKLKFTSKDGNTTYDYSGRKKFIEHHEEPYMDYAQIVLRNDDLTFGVEDESKVDLTGYWVQIGWGFKTGNAVADYSSGDINAASWGDNDVNEYSYSARLWVKSQREISAEGQLIVILYLEGVWKVMAERPLLVGTPPFYDLEPYENTTIYGILEDMIETQLTAATSYTFILSALGSQDDGIVNDYNPTLEFNNPDLEDYNTIVQRLMEMTKCYLRARAGLTFEVRYPLGSDSDDETFYSYQAHYLFDYSEVRNVLIPNYVIVYANADDYDVSGEDSDIGEISKYMEVKAIYLAGSITNVTDATNRTSAILTKAKAEILAGRLVIPHDCGMELYDRVKVYDTRGT